MTFEPGRTCQRCCGLAFDKRVKTQAFYAELVRRKDDARSCQMISVRDSLAVGANLGRKLQRRSFLFLRT